MGKYWYDNDELTKRINRDVSLESLTEAQDEDGKEMGMEVLHFLIRNQKNHKKRKIQVIRQKDLDRQDLLGQVLRDYQDGINHLKKDFRKDDGKKFVRSRAIGQMKQDMIYSKDALDGIFGYRTAVKESTVPNLSVIDLKNPAHVKVLLPMNMEFDPNNDLSFIFLDLEELIQNLNDDEKLVVDMLRDERNVSEIAQVLDITYKACQYKIRKICEKIAGF
ncbi:hypothetical protein ACIGHG_15670 [Bacillus sp. NPDC077411]|uniref:hypothetical protein n=1 Tax=Bacillus sp. NPDC077411 TaxID=3363947 RepID=UPI0037C66132